MGKWCDMLHGLKPTLMMVMVQVAQAGVTLLYKLAANDGMSLRVLIAYRFIFAAATVIPLALIIDRKKRPKMTWKTLFQAFVTGFFGGSLAQNLFAQSLSFTSATFAAAMTNLIPAFTFVLAIIFRIEGLGLNTMAGKAKVMGTLLCIGGAMLLTFYKGFDINIWPTHFDLLHKSQHQHVAPPHHNNILGLFLALAVCLSSSFSLIIQSKMSQTFPCHYSSTALISIMGAIQALVFALCTERDWTQWRLGWNLRLLCAAYMGIMGSGLMWAFIMSCVRMRGPLFVSVFNPMLLVLVALSGSLLLNEQLHLGSVLGAVVIVCGLYSVLWGKSKEMKKITRLVPSQSFTNVIQVEENRRDSDDKGHFNQPNINVMAVVPNFISEPAENLMDFGEEEEGDVEKASNVTNQN